MAKTETVRQVNKQQILDVFMKEGICTKNMLHQATGLSLGTCTNLLQKLLEEGQIIRLEDGPSTGGRKAKRYSLAEDYIQMGVMVMHHHETTDELICRVVNLRYHEVLAFSMNMAKLKKETLFEAIEQMKKSCPNMKQLAISIPGVTDHGCISFCDIEDFRNTELEKEIREKFNLDVILENDVNLAALGYAKSLPKKVHSLALVYQPSDQYCGCGMILEDQMIDGFTHFAGELGYLPIETRAEQQKSLKTKKAATILLAKQIACLTAVVNPEIVVIVSKKMSSLDKLKTKIGKWIPAEHLPQLVQIEQLDYYIVSGLQFICLDKMRVKNVIQRRS